MEEHQYITSDLIAPIFEELDQSIGLHWPILAKSIWTPINQPVASAYFSTSKTILDGLLNLLALENTFLPIFQSHFTNDNEGLCIRVVPIFPCSARINEVLDVLITLSFHAILRELPYSGVDGYAIVTKFAFEYRPFYTAFDSLLCGRVEFGCERPRAYYPFEFLNQSVGLYRPALNKLLLDQISQQSSYGKDCNSFAVEVESVIRANALSSADLNVVADKMMLTPRSLQRKLQLERTSFRAIQNRVFKEHVLLGLERQMSISKIAEIVGTVSAEALQSKVRRVFGIPLSTLRKDLNK